MFFVSVIALFCAYTHSFSVLGKICEGWNWSKIGDIAPLTKYSHQFILKKIVHAVRGHLTGSKFHPKISD
jgi:hypothetical protein